MSDTTDSTGENGIVITTDGTYSTSKTITITDGTITWTQEYNKATNLIKCSKCKEKKESHLIADRYNWTNKNHELTRQICSKCYTKAMDKFYELDRSVETEEVLYGKKEED